MEYKVMNGTCYARIDKGEEIIESLLVVQGYSTLTEDFTVYVFDPRNELPETYSVAMIEK